MNKKFTFILFISLIFSPLTFILGQYTWTGADGGSWAVSTNWSPTRTTPQITDTLRFSDGTTKTITSVPTQNVARIRILNNTHITLESDATVTLTIIDISGSDDLIVEGGSSLTLGGSNALTVTLDISATAKINAGGTFTINSGCTYNTNGTSVKTVVEGSAVNNGGTLNCTDVNKLTFGGGSSYKITATGTALPTALWNPSAKIFFDTGNSTPITVSVSSQTINQMQVTSPTQVTLTAGSPVTLTVSGYNLGGDDFVIQGSSQLTIDNNVTVTLLDNSVSDPAVAADITGFLKINSGGTYNTSGSVQTRVVGIIINSGTINSGAADDILFQDNSRLQITATGKSIPMATWVTNTTLEFNTGGVMTFDFGSTSPLTIGRLVVTNNTNAEITSGAALALNISNGTGTDLDIPSSSALTIGGSNALSLILASNATASIIGNMTINSGNSYSAGVTNGIAGTLINNGTYDFTTTSAVTTIAGTGTFINNNIVSNSTPARFIVSSGAIYRHNRDGGDIPSATWNSNSNLQITGVAATAPAGFGGQTIGNFIWDSNQSADVILGQSFTVAGNMSVNQTGDQSLTLADASARTLTVNGNFTFSSPSSNDNFILVGGAGNGILTVLGNFIKSGGSTFTLKNGDGDGTLNITGNFTMSDGNFNQRPSSITGTGIVTVTGDFNFSGSQYDFSAAAASCTLNVAGDFSHSAGTITESGAGSGLIIFNGSGARTYTSGGTLTGEINFIVNSGVTLQMASDATVITGGGTFTLQDGATLGITSADGITTSGATGNIQVTGTRTFGTGANYIYNGSTAQNVGDGYPDNLTGTLTIINSSGVTLNSTRTIANTGSLILTNGPFTAGTNLTLASTSSITRNAGSIIGTLQGVGLYDVTYTGTSKTIGDELSGAFRNITIILTAGNDLTINSNLNISGTLTFTNGRLLTGVNTINLGSSGSITGEANGTYLVGNLTVTRTVNAAVQNFGGIGVSIDPVSDNLGSTVVTRVSGPTAIITDDFGNSSIARKWTITPSSQPTSFRNVTFNWVTDDNNGNTDDSMYIALFSSTGNAPWGETGHLFHGTGSITIRINSFSTFSVIAKERAWYLFDFGTGSDTTYSTTGQSTTFLPAAIENGGTSLVSVGTGGNGSWTLESPGNFGAQRSLKGIAPSGVNKFSIVDFNGAQFSTIRFDIMFEGGVGDWYLWIGNGLTSFSGTSFPSHGNNDLFLGLWWQLGTDESISLNYRQDASWGVIDNTTFVKGVVYTVDIYMNNHNDESGPYFLGLPPDDLNPSAWDIWVDGTKISPDNGYPRIGNSVNNRVSINSFSFIGANSPGQTAIIHLDDINYSNHLDANDLPLPVELSSFTSKVTNSTVQLNWRTENEVNNFGFDVERMNSNQKDWKKLGFVQGHGNSNSPKEYSFTDKEVKFGTHSYRLKQIDNDGKFEYSDIVQVDLGLPKEITLYPNYPNPFNPSTTISFTLPKDANVTLKVFNILGQEVRTLIDGRKEAGIHSVEFDGAELTSGFYIYRIEAGDFVQVKKMLLLK